jgi:acyl-CoA synthetase (AMP-forming)/AMP-acid ligase II
MIDGEMQAFALTLDKFLEHAAKWRADAQVVTARDGGGTDRIGYADLMVRSRRASAMLAGLGVAAGDRVATLAWNSQAHVEVWYGIMGMGAVCHTLNPRLTAEHLASMIVQSEARILIASADLAPLAGQILERVPGVEHLLIIDAEGGAIPRGPGRPAGDLLAQARARSSGASSTRPRPAACASPPAPPARPRA